MSDETHDPKTALLPTDTGRLFAVASQASPFVGLPIWLVPFLLRDDDFALYHAKQSALIYLGAVFSGAIISAIATATCGVGAILFLVMPLWLIPAVMGMFEAFGGRRTPLLGVGDMAEDLFSFLHVKPKA
ncbi:MAG: hypothetical protein GWP91_13010 [Rhodobacterales bacterium]|nr:hypothetical protein [Rhodobacterales bacterium]